jgi:hypothetical protein
MGMPPPGPTSRLHVSYFADAFRALEKFPQIAVRPVIQAEPFATGIFESIVCDSVGLSSSCRKET